VFEDVYLVEVKVVVGAAQGLGTDHVVAAAVRTVVVRQGTGVVVRIPNRFALLLWIRKEENKDQYNYYK
jgi:hypothetical protein